MPDTSTLLFPFKGTVSRDFLLLVFSPQPQSIPLGPFQIFSKIHGDIHKSRCTTGINDTGGKFASGVNYTGGKIAISINNTGGKFATGVNNTRGKFANGVNNAGGKLLPV
jgi:hypothetical protein